jgi:hypothetical protein
LLFKFLVIILLLKISKNNKKSKKIYKNPLKTR